MDREPKRGPHASVPAVQGWPPFSCLNPRRSFSAYPVSLSSKLMNKRVPV